MKNLTDKISLIIGIFSLVAFVQLIGSFYQNKIDIQVFEKMD